MCIPHMITDLGQKVTSQIYNQQSLPLQFPAISEDLELHKRLLSVCWLKGLHAPASLEPFGFTGVSLCWLKQHCSTGQQEMEMHCAVQEHNEIPKKPLSTRSWWWTSIASVYVAVELFSHVLYKNGIINKSKRLTFLVVLLHGKDVPKSYKQSFMSSTTGWWKTPQSAQRLCKIIEIVKIWRENSWF